MKERRLCTEPSNNDINQLEEFNQQKQGTFLRSLIMPKLYFKRHTEPRSIYDHPKSYFNDKSIVASKLLGK